MGTTLLCQSPAPGAEDINTQVKQLSDAIQRTESQMDDQKKQLEELKHQLQVLQQRLSGTAPVADTPEVNQDNTTKKLDEVAEKQEIQEAEIATHDQSKVESTSRYLVRVNGLLLLNGFVNSSAVDTVSSPSIALAGSGSTGASVSQTVLGIDVAGPRLFGATSYGDVRVDFFGFAANSANSAYAGATSFLRLRTAHAGLQWKRTEAYFALDKPLISPDSPTSITATGVPALAWAGNLWTWNPQLGISTELPFSEKGSIGLQAALIDVGDAPYSSAQYVNTTSPQGSTGQQSRWPGVEARIAWLGKKDQFGRKHFGVSGYYGPHRTPFDRTFDSWAAAMDLRSAIGSHFEVSANAYRGAGLGGLGGGTYKDFLYSTSPTRTFFRPLEDVGGWVQLKQRVSQRIEFNEAFGVDNAFSRWVRRYEVVGGNAYANLARNQAITGNVIYSPSRYLQFSGEYRHLRSFPASGAPNLSHIFGLAAGFKF